MKNKSSREEVIYGFHPVYETLKSKNDLSKIFLDRGKKFPKDFLDKIKEGKVPVSYVPKVKLNSLTKGNHQGVVAVVAPIKFVELTSIFENKKNKHKYTFLILNGITDVRNIGAMMRTAECTGVDAVIIDYKCGMLNSDCMKISAGAMGKIPICRVKNLFNVIDTLKEMNIKIVACSEKGNENIFSTNLNQSVAFIMGSEENGIEKKIIEKVNVITRIPMKSEISSLNVSVAAAIFLYENFRQNIK